MAWRGLDGQPQPCSETVVIQEGLRVLPCFACVCPTLVNEQRIVAPSAGSDRWDWPVSHKRGGP